MRGLMADCLISGLGAGESGARLGVASISPSRHHQKRRDDKDAERSIARGMHLLDRHS